MQGYLHIILIQVPLQQIVQVGVPSPPLVLEAVCLVPCRWKDPDQTQFLASVPPQEALLSALNKAGGGMP